MLRIADLVVRVKSFKGFKGFYKFNGSGEGTGAPPDHFSKTLLSI